MTTTILIVVIILNIMFLRNVKKKFDHELLLRDKVLNKLKEEVKFMEGQQKSLMICHHCEIIPYQIVKEFFQANKN